MSNYGGGGYGYPQNDDNAGGYGYPTNYSGGYGYPEAPQHGGSLQPLNLGPGPGFDSRGKIGRADGSYYTCAHWFWRVLAGLIDYGPLLVAYRMVSNATVSNVDVTNGFRAHTDSNLPGLLFFFAVLFVIGNSIVLQGLTAQSLGKKLFGLQVVRGVTDGKKDLVVRPGLWWTSVRLLLHVLDILCWVGLLAPLWTYRRQTFADMICNTVVLREPEPIVLVFTPAGWQSRKL